MTFKDLNREHILAVLAQVDELGEPAFLKKYGYRPANKYKLRHRNRLYSSKAILGVAAGLESSQFSGGAAHACRVLGKLGFTVVTQEKPKK